MKDTEKRKEAISLYIAGEPINAITEKLKQCRMWFYKWLKRYKEDPDGKWYDEQSRRPRTYKKKSHQKLKPKLLLYESN